MVHRVFIHLFAVFRRLVILGISTSLATLAYASCVNANATFTQTLAETAQVVIISHKASEEIDLSDVKRLFTLNKKLWNNGTRAVLVALPADAPESVAMFRSLFSVYPYQMQRTWDRAVFSGKASPPITKKTSQEAIAYVIAHKGAIAYVSVANNAELTRLQEQVNVVSIIK